MKLLDLFCGAGGASMGYTRAGFEVTGVDIDPQPRYPFKFIQRDAMRLDPRWMLEFDAIHASPPCQAYSQAREMTDREYPDLIGPVRKMLRVVRRPFVIENVIGAPLHRPVGLCGSMFGLGAGAGYLQRHRLFEYNGFSVNRDMQCKHGQFAIDVVGHGRPGQQLHIGIARKRGEFTQAERQQAMGIDWMNRDELAEAIPPAYTEWIGRQLIAHLEGRRVEA